MGNNTLDIWFVMSLVTYEIVTLREVQEYYTLEDLVLLHECHSAKNLYESQE